jgi:hypothetical protein
VLDVRVSTPIVGVNSFKIIPENGWDSDERPLPASGCRSM